jgi:hypothetical protein
MWQDSPEQFEILASLLARAARPAFGSIVVRLERGKIALIEEHRTHK